MCILAGPRVTNIKVSILEFSHVDRELIKRDVY